jgi:glutathione S-transferase
MAATPNIMLYTAATPNGRKASVLLEELKSAYGLSYEYKTLSLSQNEQKAKWFLKVRSCL